MVQNAFVALDFETANSKRTSICSVGMVKVIDNQITESFHTLLTTLLKQILLYMASIPKMCKMLLDSLLKQILLYMASIPKMCKMLLDSSMSIHIWAKTFNESLPFRFSRSRSSCEVK